MATLTISFSLFGMFQIASRMIERRIKEQVDERLGKIEKQVANMEISLKGKS
jgi:hypothetical protein